MQILPDALKTALIPRSSCVEDGRKELVARCARVTAAASFLLLTGYFLLADVFLGLLFPDSFAPAAPLVRILALGFFIRTLGKSLEPYLIGRNRPGVISLSVATGMIVNIILLFLLLPRLGLAGAAWSVVFNYLISSLILILSFKRLSLMNWTETWRPRGPDFNFLGDLRARFISKPPRTL